MAIIWLTLLILAPAAARAEEVFTSQAAAAHATDSTWIPAPERRASLCIVDTGNDINPDTSNVIARFAVDGGPTTDLHPDHHGTLMSMIAAAPYNGFGMVGAAPSINIVSVRASRDGRSFAALDVRAAIQQCIIKAPRYNVKAVSLSLGGQLATGLDAASIDATQDAISNARRVGLNVIAAAGNRPGAVDWPASYPAALAVGAATSAGARCAFSPEGAEIDVWAPGCPQDVALPDGRAAWASGSSEATAYVAAVITQLRGLRPELTVDDAERMLASSADDGQAGPLVNVEALFRSADAGASLLVGRDIASQLFGETLLPSGDSEGLHDAYRDVPATPTESRQPGLAIAPSVGMPSDVTRQLSALPSPRIGLLRLRSQVLTAALKNKPQGATVTMRVYELMRGHRFPSLARVVVSTHDRVRTRTLGIVSQVTMIYRDPSGRRDPSRSVSFKLKR